MPKVLLFSLLLIGCQARLTILPEYGYVQVDPTVTALSETSIGLQWTAPTQSAVHEYRVLLAGEDSGQTFDQSATSATISGLAPGSVGTVVVQAIVDDGALKIPAIGATYFTPHGALGTPSVNTVETLGGTPGGTYAEGAVFSSTFSMMFAHAFIPEASYVFAGLPTSPTARPLFNWAGAAMNYQNGLTFGAAYPAIVDFSGIWSDGVSKVAVTDRSASRVVLYDALPTSAQTLNPSRILGQTDFTSRSANAGSPSVNGIGFSFPAGVCFDGTTLYVADASNHRVLGWHGWPTSTGQVADFALGQASVTANGGCNAGGLSKGSLCFPNHLACGGGKLAVTDFTIGAGGNQRVLVWNTAPTSNVPADTVVGQIDDAHNGANGAGGVSAGGFSAPAGVAIVPNGGSYALLVADNAQNRVLQWNTVPVTDGAPFDLVYGQPDSTTVTANSGGTMSASTLSGPQAVSTEVGTSRFWVSDFGNGRWLRYQLGTTAAIGLYGQPTFTASATFEGGSDTATTWSWNQYGRSLAICDSATGTLNVAGRHWATPATDGNTPYDFRTNGDFTQIGSRIYWTANSNQILSRPGTLSSGAFTPDIALGSRDTSDTVVTAATNDYQIVPTQLATDGTSLFVADGPRIVGYSSSSALTTSNHTIEFAIGQPDLVTRTANAGGISAARLSSVGQMLIYNGMLIVADTGNNRVLIWNHAPTASNVAADIVLGQTAPTLSATGTGLAQMNAPLGVTVLNGKLLVSDTGNNRILVWKTIPTVTGAAADSSWSSLQRFSLPDWYHSRMLVPGNISACSGKLYLSQYDRVTVLPDLF